LIGPVVRARRSGAVLLAALCVACGGSDGGQDGGRTLRVSGSTTVAPIAADAAEVLRDRGMRITVDSQGGSAGGIAQLGVGEIDVAMSSKPITEDEKARHRGVDFVSTELGADAVAVAVRREVFDGGVENLARDQLRALFEGRVGNWAEVGGPDLAVFVYDKEPGRGTREVLDRYLYGPGGHAPPPPRSGNYAVVGGNEETRAKLVSTPGSVAPLSTAFVAGQPRLAAVSVDGVEPTPAHVRDGRYPMARMLTRRTEPRVKLH
jgi:phosphate transport system substrate-binding protein